jgi:hypothetical protein
VYDGPSYRILRKYHRLGLDILILSAKYGLISGNERISSYDRRMTKEIAAALRSENTKRLEEILSANRYSEIWEKSTRKR